MAANSEGTDTMPRSHTQAAVSLLAAAGLMAGVAGCSGALDKTAAANAIDKAMAAQPRSQDCVLVAGIGEVNWPLKATITSSTQWPNPILEAMQRAGYLSLDKQDAPLGGLIGGTDSVTITPTAAAKGWYDPQRGFCVGHFTVDQVTRFSQPGSGPGTASDAQFTWKLADVPSWAQRQEFNAIPGLAASAAGSAHLEKTNDGWVASDVKI